jgi:hypothetical protein
VRNRIALLTLGIVTAASRLVDARQRPLFEPTDLEMERPGVIDIDLQLGAVRGPSSWRLVVPDVEIDVGLLPNVELDIDGAYAIEGPGDGQFSFDHPAPENLWLAAKLGLFDWRQVGASSAWALGLQLGPKLPVANDAHGIGYEALLIGGRTWGESHLVFNLGALLDPGPAISSKRPAGIEGGIDVNLRFGSSPLSLTGEIGSVHFVSPDPDQLHATAGLTWAASEQLDLSLVGLVGFLPGTDRSGVLLGVSPKLPLW